MNQNAEDSPVPPSPKRRTTRARRTMWPIVLGGLGIAYSPMWLPTVAEMSGIRLDAEGPASVIPWNILGVVALLVWLLVVERRDLASIGMTRPTSRDVEWALYLFGGCMAWQWIAMLVWPPAQDAGTTSITSMSVLAVVGLIVSAAVCEEILYRGYPIERLSEVTGRRWIAYALTVPIFVAPHVVFFGAQWLWTSGAGALAIYLLYARRRNLPACMLLHLCVNLPILIPTIAQHVGG
jgi:membrane protease YdiL (CAAX protease family)